MLKTLFFCLLPFTFLTAAEIDLRVYEKSLYSEYGEDGILAKLFQLIPPKNRYFVHLGSGDGSHLSATYLLRLQDWKGLLLDRQYENTSIDLHREFIQADKINTLLEKYQVPFTFPLLVIDLHYSDFHVWQALSPRYQPEIVVVNYNGTIPPSEDKIIQYRPFYSGDHTDYFSGSILSFYRLGKQKGYSLVYAESGGAYLFFVRTDRLKDLSFVSMNDVEALYRPAKKSYTPDPKQKAYSSFGESP